jgi:hypothetical protein
VRDELLRGLRVLEVREDHDHRSPAKAKRQVSECVTEVRLNVLRLDGVQLLGDPAQLRAASFGLDEARDPVVEGHEPDSVAVGLRDPREHERGVDGMVELVELAGRRGHETPAVDRDHHLLPALGLDLDHDRVVASSRGRPADSPDVVAAHIVTQAGEGGRSARRPRPPQAGHHAKAPPQSELHALDGDHIREDRHLVWMLQPHLASPPAVTPRDLKVDRAEFLCAAPW